MFRKQNTKSMVSACVLAIVIGVGGANAQEEFTHHDDFNDMDVTEATDGGHWVFDRQSVEPNTMDASSGDLVFKSANIFVHAKLVSFDGVELPERTEWSFRARMTVHDGPFAAVGTTVFNHAGLVTEGGGSLRVGTTTSYDLVPLPYSYLGEEVFIQLDAFDGLLTGYVWKEGDDPTSVVQLSKPYNPRTILPNFGVGGSSPANVTFHEAWVSTSPLPVSDPVIPEPSTLPLAGLGLFGVFVWRRQ